jgi:hypothetical protein
MALQLFLAAVQLNCSGTSLGHCLGCCVDCICNSTDWGGESHRLAVAVTARVTGGPAFPLSNGMLRELLRMLPG